MEAIAQQPSRARRQARDLLPEIVLLAVFALLLGWDIGGRAPWWDEGWTMSVARNLAERGYYGRILAGELAPNGLEAAPPVVGVVALSYTLFGVGVWQARLPILLMSFAALALLYALARQIYGRAVALATLAVLLLMPVLPQLHVLNLSRQVMAEMPLLCFLLAGYVLLTGALSGRAWLLLPAALCWALAFYTKYQYISFWAASLSGVVVLLLLRRQLRLAGMLASALVGSYLLLRFGLIPLQGMLLAGRTMPVVPLDGLTEAIALVLEPTNRLVTLQLTLTVMLPGALSCSFAAWQAWRRWRAPEPAAAAEVMRLSLLALVVVWWGWYLFLSVGVIRYIFPAYVLSSVFQAALLAQLTGGFDLRATLGAVAGLLRRQRPLGAGAGALLAVLIVSIWCTGTILFMSAYYRSLGDYSLERTARFLNTQTPPDALIESYDTELFTLLDRPYHYPPDQVHVELIVSTQHGRPVELTYDPLAADPDYLVIGAFGRHNVLYDQTLAGDDWRLVFRDGLYDVYQRVRR
jgi:4-amino-4-deoxy-L-arabinose transferase-like glycosyltransferase